jgi:hypothetical protein
MLDKIVEDMNGLPGMPKREADIAVAQLNRVNDALKEALERLDATFITSAQNRRPLLRCRNRGSQARGRLFGPPFLFVAMRVFLGLPN